MLIRSDSYLGIRNGQLQGAVQDVWEFLIHEDYYWVI